MSFSWFSYINIAIFCLSLNKILRNQTQSFKRLQITHKRYIVMSSKVCWGL